PLPHRGDRGRSRARLPGAGGVRVLVHGAGVAGDRRMRGAAIGLAHRGHELAWLGKGGEDAAREAPIHDLGGGAGRLAGFRADVVLGAGSPWGPVWRGWLAGAGVLVQAVAAGQVTEWSGFE